MSEYERPAVKRALKYKFPLAAIVYEVAACPRTTKSAFTHVVFAARATDGVMMQTVAHAVMNVTRTRRLFMAVLLVRRKAGSVWALDWGGSGISS